MKQQYVIAIAVGAAALAGVGAGVGVYFYNKKKKQGKLFNKAPGTWRLLAVRGEEAKEDGTPAVAAKYLTVDFKLTTDSKAAAGLSYWYEVDKNGTFIISPDMKSAVARFSNADGKYLGKGANGELAWKDKATDITVFAPENESDEYVSFSIDGKYLTFDEVANTVKLADKIADAAAAKSQQWYQDSPDTE